MKKLYTILLLVVMLALVHTQDDTSDLDTQSTSANPNIVGAAEVISVEDELQTEALEHSKVIYESSNFESSYGSLRALSTDPNLKSTMQVVSGILYTFYWTTESDNIVVIKVHMVPWKQNESERFPVLSNQITLYQAP